MNQNLYNRLLITVLCIFSITCLSCFRNTGNGEKLHTWEMYEIKLLADKEQSNSYTDVTCWVELKGPDFSKRIYGFWDGGNIFKVRVVATEPGKWHWQSFSNQPDDNGLNNKQGEFDAIGWSKKDIAKNPNRHGFIRPSKTGHSLQYADGTPFFLIGDTWLAGFRPHIWDAMKYESANYMRHLGEFILSEGDKFQDLEPVQEDLLPRKAAGSFDNGLDGWSYMMRNREKDFALLYFENGAVKPTLKGFIPGRTYSLIWYDPQKGEWEKPLTVRTDDQGSLTIPSFPDSQNPSVTDWALKIKMH